MPSIDERVVSMAFENAKFEAGVAHTMTTLAKLDSSLQKIGQTNSLGEIEKAANKITLEKPMSALDKLKGRFSRAGDGADKGMSDIEKAGNKVKLEQPIKALDKVKAETGQVGRGAADGFGQIEKSANRVNLGGLTSALDNVSNKFSLLEGAASVALGNIASKAAMKGASFAKSFAFAPIKDGFDEYKTNLNSIQTILANTDGQRISGLDQVNKHLNELNTYSDQTIYNFSEMAKNIGTFTAAGVDMDKSTQSIKGIANLAALSGSNSQQASTAMYQLSQAISSGRVGLQDWNSVVNAGMGGAVFQKSLMRTAENMGALTKGAVNVDKATGKATVNGKSFRESIQAKPGEQSWLTSEVLVETLGQLTGDMSKAQLIAKGFSDSQATAIMRQAATAKAAATEVKTLSQVFDVAKETIGSGWSKTFQLIFGDFNQSKKTFTQLSNAINGWINTMSEARNKLLGVWSALGGRQKLLDGLQSAFGALFTVISPITEAFRHFFPAATGKQLYDLTVTFERFATATQSWLAQHRDDLIRTFQGFFAVLHIGYSIVKGVLGVIGDLLGIVGHSAGGFLGFTASIGDFLTAVDQVLTKGGVLKTLFQGITAVLQAPIRAFIALNKLVFGLFGGMGDGGAKDFGASLGLIAAKAGPLTPVLLALKKAWDGIVHMFQAAKDLVSPWLDKIGQQLSNIGTVIGNALKTMDFDKVMSALQTTFVGGIFLVLKKAITGGTTALTGALNGFKGVLGGVTSQLETMQQKVKATILLEIAIAMGVLALAIVALSQIDPKKLTSSLSAIAVGLFELMTAMKMMSSGMGKMATLQLPIIAASMVVMAGALIVLSYAVKKFAEMSWQDLAKGLIGVGGGLGVMALGMRLLPPASVIQGLGLIALAAGMVLLAKAVASFAKMKWQDLGKGIYGVFVSLTALLIPLSIAGPELILVGPGLVAAAIGMNLLAGAVAAFGSMKTSTLVKGVLGMAAALLVLAPTVTAMALSAPGAVGLAAAAIAVTILAGAMGVLGNMSVGAIAKSVVALAASMLILATGVTAMVIAAPGAVALLAVSAALAVLAPTLAFLGTLDWSTIFKGLASMVLVLGTLSVVGLVASTGLEALGISMLPLAAVFVVTAAAVYLLAKGLAALGDSGGKGIAVMVTAVTAFIALLPKMVIEFVKGLVEIVAEIAKILPKVVVSLGVILDTIIAFVIRSAPKLAVAIGVLVDSVIAVLVQNAPKLIAAGFKLLTDLLSGIDKNIEQITLKAASIITKFLTTLTSKAGQLVAAGANFVVHILTGLAAQVPKIVSAAIRLVGSFLEAIVGELPRVLTMGARLIGNLIIGIFKVVGRVVDAGLRVVINIVNGIAEALPRIVTAGANVIKKFINAIANVGPDLVDAGFKAVIKFLHGIATAIRENNKDLVDAGLDIADAIVHGLVDGLGTVAHRVLKPVIEDLFDSLPKWARKILGIHSPSTVFHEVGQNIVRGVATGTSGMPKVLKAKIIDPLHDLIRQNKDAKDMGSFIGGEFLKGLSGGLWGDGKSNSQTTIEGAFASLRGRFADEQQKLHDYIKSSQDQLDQELAKKGKDRNNKLVLTLMKNLHEARDLLKQSAVSSDAWGQYFQSAQNALVPLANLYEDVAHRIDDAKNALVEATRARDDAIRSYTDQYSQLPKVDDLVSEEMARQAMTKAEREEADKKKAAEADKKRRIDQVMLYKKALYEQFLATKQYHETLNKLRAAGLDDTTYKKLLEQGTAGQQFADQLLASGKAGIENLNALDAQLLQEAGGLAQDSASQLYQAGIDAAQGFVDGLQKYQDNIKAVMENIANQVVSALQTALGIHSPSTVLAEVGTYAGQGLADGLAASTGGVGRAATDLADGAISAIQNSLSDGVVMEGLNLDPTITPVVDLSNVEAGVGKMNTMWKDVNVSGEGFVGSSLNLGGQTASEVASTGSTSGGASTSGGGTSGSIIFEQNNYSPESLPPDEIYRATNNQLAQAKQVLGFSYLSIDKEKPNLGGF